MKKSNKKYQNLILNGATYKFQITLIKQKTISFIRFFKNSKLNSFSNLAKKLLTLLAIAILSMITGACVDKKSADQNSNSNSVSEYKPIGIDPSKAFFVTPNGRKDKDCTTWENACDLQSAIDKAYKHKTKKVVLVEEGQYYPDPDRLDETKTFELKDGVEIYGGINKLDVTEYRKKYSMLFGYLENNKKTKLMLKGENLTNKTILDGFEIMLAESSDTSQAGAGLYLNNSSPKLSNLIFSDNNLKGQHSSGGAIHISNNSNPTIVNSKFYNNSSKANGGAIYNENSNISLINVVFIKNSANYGGAIYNKKSNSSISNVNFIENSAKNEGGAVYNYISGLNISNSILWNNKVKLKLNSIYNEKEESKPIIKNSIFNKNSNTGKNITSDITTYNNKTPNQLATTSMGLGMGKVTDEYKEIVKDAGDNGLYLEVYNKIYDKKTTEIPPNDKDLINNPRLNGNTIDIGAHEFQE